MFKSSEAIMGMSAEYAGASERILTGTAFGALAFLAGYEGWDDEAPKSLDVMKKELIAACLDNPDNKKTQAYRRAKTMLNVGVALAKMPDNDLVCQMRDCTTAVEAAALLVNEWKANNIRTDDQLEQAFSDAPTPKAKTTTAQKAEKTVNAVAKQAKDGTLSDEDLDKIVTIATKDVAAVDFVMGVLEQAIADKELSTEDLDKIMVVCMNEIQVQEQEAQPEQAPVAATA